MKGFSFPIWVIKYVLDNKTFKTDKDVVSKLIDNYCGIFVRCNLHLLTTFPAIAAITLP